MQCIGHRTKLLLIHQPPVQCASSFWKLRSTTQHCNALQSNEIKCKCNAIIQCNALVTELNCCSSTALPPAARTSMMHCIIHKPSCLYNCTTVHTFCTHFEKMCSTRHCNPMHSNAMQWSPNKIAAHLPLHHPWTIMPLLLYFLNTLVFYYTAWHEINDMYADDCTDACVFDRFSIM